MENYGVLVHHIFPPSLQRGTFASLDQDQVVFLELGIVFKEEQTRYFKLICTQNGHNSMEFWPF